MSRGTSYRRRYRPRLTLRLVDWYPKLAEKNKETLAELGLCLARFGAERNGTMQVAESEERPR